MVSEQHAEYYAARAEGGAGISVLEEHIVHSSDMPYERAVLGYLPGTAQAVTAGAECIQGHCAVALVQLQHNRQQAVGHQSQPRTMGPSPGTGVSSSYVSQGNEKG